MNFHLQGNNFVNINATPKDIECLFDEPVITIAVDCLDWTDIAVACGFFPSKGQARKNGWNGPVPRGFGQRKFGNRGLGVWFFNPEKEINQ